MFHIVQNKRIQPIEFFTKNIGKRIYRDGVKCCKDCEEIAEKGLLVRNKKHALYLFGIQNDYADDNIFLNYRKKK